MSASFREALIKRSSNVDIYEASLESARFQQTAEQGPFLAYLHSLFKGRKLDLIVAMGAPAVRFVQEHRPFSGIPLIMGGADERVVEYEKLRANETAVTVRLDPSGLINNILEVLPKTNRVLMVFGSAPQEQYWMKEFQRELQPFTKRVTFEWVNDLSLEELVKRVAVLPENSAVWSADIRVDGAGVPRDGVPIVARLREASSAPIFSYMDDYIGQGIVGGRLVSGRELGQRIAEVSLRILEGESPENIRLPAMSLGTPVYDARELQRAGISEDDLPPGSEVRFRIPTVWEQYRWAIVLIIAAILFQSALIARLLYEKRRRRKAEIEARQRMSELAHMNRAATAGELSASIAHELNQPLGAILNNTEIAEILLKSPSPNLEDIKEILADIKRDDQRASEVIKGLRGLLSKSAAQPQEIDLNEAVREVFEFLSRQASSRGVILSSALSPDMLRVKGDRIQLQQVILNLVVNGMDAMVDGEVKERRIVSRTALVDGVAEVSIVDCGPGIPPDKLPHLFEPFFTTKKHGMGMGLSIARTIVEAHGGRIWAENVIGGGALFRLNLPLAQAH